MQDIRERAGVVFFLPVDRELWIAEIPPPIV